MAVSGGVVALSEEVRVLLVCEIGGVESMRGGELKVLLVEVVVCFGVVHGDRVVRGKVPDDLNKLRFEVRLCSFPERREELGGIGYWVGVDLACDDGEQLGTDELVDFLDPDEVSCGWVWRSLNGEGELVVSAEAGGGGFPSGGVIASS